MTGQSTITTNFLILSDTHDFQFDDTSAGESIHFQLPTPKIDVVLHCGDLTQVGGVTSFKKALKMLGHIEAELKLVVAGNHDLELDREFWEAQRDDDGIPEDPKDHVLAVQAMTGPLAREAGVTFLHEGTYSFSLKNGAEFTIYVSPYTPAFCDWAFAYKHNEDRFNESDQVMDGSTSISRNPMRNGVDIVMTHGPPKGILDRCSQGNVGCENLRRAIGRVKPMMHCFGHIHEGYGIEPINWRESPADESELLKGNTIENPYPQPLEWKDPSKDHTLAVNAAIMTGDYKPENAPWLISLDLPRRP